MSFIAAGFLFIHSVLFCLAPEYAVRRPHLSLTDSHVQQLAPGQRDLTPICWRAVVMYS